MSKLSIQKIAGTGKRSDARLRVRLPAKLITLDGEFRVVLCDLSTGGARLGKPGLVLSSGEAVLLWGHHCEAFGRLAWSRSGLAGMHFDEPISKDWVIATRALDCTERLPDDRELRRIEAHDWFTGKARV